MTTSLIQAARAALIAASLATAAQASPAEYVIADLDAGRDAIDVHWGRRGPGPKLDLFVLGAGSVRIWEQSSSGFAPAPTTEIALPDDSSFVDFGDVAGDAGEEIVLANRRGVFADAHGSSPANGGPFQRILAVPGVPVPLEHARATFIRDITGDGKGDLIIPVRGGYEVFYRKGEGFEKGVTLEGEHKVSVDPGGPGLLEPLQLELRIPQLKLKDLNGDGRIDIIARTREKTRCYLQGPDGFKSQPTYELDLARFRESGEGGEKGKRGGKSSGGGILGGGAIKVHEVDIDGDGIQDYLIAAGQFLRVYFGGKEGADFSRPHVMLKLSSELQGVGSFDIDGDGRLDLVALKFELPGLPKLIAAYFVSMSLDFEVLGYKNEGGRRFSRRPDWRNTLSLALPPLREVLEGFDTFAERFLEAASKRGRFAAGDVNGDGLLDAAFLDDDNVLRVFYGRAGQGRPGDVKLGNILFDAKKSSWELRELLDFVASASLAAARQSIAGRKADLEVPVGGGYDAREVSLEVRDLNADGRGDFVLRWGGGKLRIALSTP